jgi:hypothetical protein
MFCTSYNGSCNRLVDDGHDKCLYHRLHFAMLEEAENTISIKNFHDNFIEVISERNKLIEKYKEAFSHGRFSEAELLEEALVPITKEWLMFKFSKKYGACEYIYSPEFDDIVVRFNLCT